MKRSETTAKLQAALAKFQSEVEDPAKDESNPFFKSKYVPLDALIRIIRPTLSKYGLSFTQMPGGDGQTVSITTSIMHESGEWIESDPLIMKPVKTDPQGMGSAITYARRYALGAVLGIGWQDDDDANYSSGKVAAQKEPTKAQILTDIVNEAQKRGYTNENVSTVIKEHFKKNKSAELTYSEALDLKKNLDNYWLDYMKKMGDK